MKELLAIVFFGGSLLLTPRPIDIGKEWLELIPKNTIKAVNSSGTLYVDITNTVGYVPDAAELDLRLPKGTIQAELVAESGKIVNLKNGSAYSYSQDHIEVIMLPDTEMPVGVKFKKVRVRSGTALKSATVTFNKGKL